MATRSEIYGGFLKATAQGTLGMPGFPEVMVGTISKVTTHEFDDGKQQRVIFFEEAIPELGLNATNWDAIAAFTGEPDDEAWPGHKVEMFVVPENKSKTGHAVRVRKPRAAKPVEPPAAPVVTLGAAAASKLTLAIMEANKKSPFATIDNLRTRLMQRFPLNEAVIAGEPSSWHKSWAAAIKEWLDAPEKDAEKDDLPF